jgi:hypothetical protein
MASLYRIGMGTAVANAIMSPVRKGVYRDFVFVVIYVY